jgi:hypothetical protein
MDNPTRSGHGVARVEINGVISEQSGGPFTLPLQDGLTRLRLVLGGGQH